MFGFLPSRRPTVDLAIVRETLEYMHDDARRVPGLDKVAAAMARTIAEIEAAERATVVEVSERASVPSVVASQFVPYRPAP